MPYTRLDPERILATATALRRRVESRFHDRGLARVAQEIVALTHQTIDDARALTPPLWWLRALIALIILGGAVLFLSVGSVISLNQLGTSAIQSVESIEAAINTALLAGLGLAALIQLESRIKGARGRKGLHRLRSVIHTASSLTIRSSGSEKPGQAATNSSVFGSAVVRKTLIRPPERSSANTRPPGPTATA